MPEREQDSLAKICGESRHEAFDHRALGISGYKLLSMFCDLGVGKKSGLEFSSIIINIGLPRRTVFRKIRILERLGYVKRYTPVNPWGMARKPKSLYYLAKYITESDLQFIAQELGTWRLYQKKLEMFDFRLLKQSIRADSKIEAIRQDLSKLGISIKPNLRWEQEKAACQKEVDELKREGRWPYKS